MGLKAASVSAADQTIGFADDVAARKTAVDPIGLRKMNWALLGSDRMQEIFPNAKSGDFEHYLPALNRYLQEYNMTTPERVAAFLGQVGVESMGFTKTSEDLYYKTPGLLTRTFGSTRFPTLESEADYLRNPEKLANYVYADRYANGSPSSGDGWAYRGSGLLQITFKDNYSRIGGELGLDLVANPDLVRNDPDVSVRASLQFWKDRELNQYVDTGNYAGLTKKINSASMDYTTRLDITQQALQVLRQPK
jgi:putative chitinase